MNRIDEVRKKYLLFQSLNKKEKEILQRDFEGDDYKNYIKEDNEPFLIPEKYSSTSTYNQIQKKISGRKIFVWKQWSVAASVLALLVLLSFSIYYSSFRIITVATGYGEIKEIVLPDNSKVKLNALSKISYPICFSKNNRKINLSGEAFFDIQKDQSKPFFVYTKNYYVEVLGTKFNMQSYNNEPIQETALLEGLIAIHYDNKQQIINPGQIASYDYSKRILTIQEGNIASLSEWQNNILAFDNISLMQIFKILERKYPVSFIFEDSSLKNLHFTASFSRGESLKEILDVLSSTDHFTYFQKENNYIIRKKNE